MTPTLTDADHAAINAVLERHFPGLTKNKLWDECNNDLYLAGLAAGMERAEKAEAALAQAQAVVNEQAEDPALWFVAQYASENCLQEALRRLHAAVEGEKWTAELPLGGTWRARAEKAEAALAERDKLLREVHASRHWPEEGQAWGYEISESLHDRIDAAIHALAQEKD